MKIHYAHSNEAWQGVVSFIQKQILDSKAQRILEVGAGANPTFSSDFVKEHQLVYSILDISEEELAKAPDGYDTVLADISSPGLNLPNQYDFIFSRMLAEHIKDGEAFHQNVFNLLAPGGIVFHFFPTLYAPPFVLNRLLPEELARKVLNLIQSGREQHGKHAKFPAYYSWCRGPSQKQIQKFEKIGFEVKEYIGFFGHSGYYQKVPIVDKIHRRISTWLVNHPIPLFTSFAYVVLGKN